MDPVTATSLAGSVVSIVDVLARSVSFLANLQTKYKRADLTVSLLIGQLSTLRAALNQISEWITSNLAALHLNEQLVSDLTISINGCEFLVLALEDRIDSFDRNADRTLNSLGKAQLLWEENGTNDFLNHLNNQINALNLFLTALQCRSLFEQRYLLQSDESRRIVNLIEDDMSSLRWLRDENSHDSRKSILTENSQMLDTDFDFDREIFNSKVYEAAIRSTMRQALSGKADKLVRRKRFPLDSLTHSFDHVRLDDNGNEDTQTVREERLGPFLSGNALLNEEKLELGPSSSRDELLDESQGELRSRTKPSEDVAVDSRLVPAVAREPVNSSAHKILPLNNDVASDQAENIADPTLASVRKNRIYTKFRDRLAFTYLDGDDIRGMRKRTRFAFLANGLNFRNLSTSAALKRSGEIDEQLRVENEEKTAGTRIRIFGTSQSGKSVLSNSMKFHYYGDDAFSHEDREGFKKVIFTHMVDRMQDILDAMKSSGLLLEDQEDLQHVATIYMKQPARMDSDPLDPNVALAINALWNDRGVQRYFIRYETRQMIKSFSYFFDSISRIALPDYVPTDQDILRSWVPTTGITATVFPVDGLTYRLFDVGGTRTERLKRFHVFEGVLVILHVVDISEYDQVLYENEKISRMGESLVLFDSICKCRWFQRSSIALFFTKIDCLEDKLATRPIKDYFSDFSGDPNCLGDVKKYIEWRFLSLNKNPQRKIDVYYTSLVSETNLGETAFAAIREILRHRKQKNMKIAGKH